MDINGRLLTAGESNDLDEAVLADGHVQFVLGPFARRQQVKYVLGAFAGCWRRRFIAAFYSVFQGTSEAAR
ncbi:MAG: hypothetical protein ABIQ47_00355 [Tepidiformaceae bacterium]